MIHGSRLFTITLIGFVDSHLLIPIVALYAASLGATVGQIGLVVGVYSGVNTVANIIGGRIVDRHGEKGPLLAGLTGDAVAMFTYSICQTPWHLIATRAFHGLAGGLVGPATMSATTESASSRRRGRAMGGYGAAIALASLIGYGGGGVLATRFGFDSVFYLGGVTLIGGLFLALTLPKRFGTTAPSVASDETPRSVWSLLFDRNLRFPYASVLAQYVTFGCIVAILPVRMQGLGLAALHVGMFLATISAVFVLWQLAAGHLSDRLGRLLPATVGLAIIIVAVIVLPLPSQFPMLLAIAACIGIGFGLVFPSICALVADHAPAGDRGRAMGLFHALLTAGVAIGAPIGGYLSAQLNIETALVLTGLAPAIVLTLGINGLLRSRQAR